MDGVQSRDARGKQKVDFRTRRETNERWRAESGLVLSDAKEERTKRKLRVGIPS